jgi:hypothetical protein
VKLEVFLQFQRFVEGLAADLANWTDLARVLSHVVEQIFFLSEDVAANVASMLDSSCVNGDMFLQAVETGELAAADAAHEEATVVLNGRRRVAHFGD